jgi:DNA-binding NtrC family response regulator
MRPLKVMIVEDEKDLLNLYKEALPKSWTLDCFDNAREAAAKYSAHSDYDLVVTDINMAMKSGEGLIYDIKYVNPSQKIIVLSGHIGDLKLRDSFNVKIFQKPWDIRQIVDVYNNWESDTSITAKD